MRTNEENALRMERKYLRGAHRGERKEQKAARRVVRTLYRAGLLDEDLWEVYRGRSSREGPG